MREVTLLKIKDCINGDVQEGKQLINASNENIRYWKSRRWIKKVDSGFVITFRCCQEV